MKSPSTAAQITDSQADSPGDPKFVTEEILRQGYVSNDTDAHVGFIVGEDTVDVIVTDDGDVPMRWSSAFTTLNIASLCNWYLLQFPGMRHVPRQPSPPGFDSPVVVCLCGSTRFYGASQRANYEETMAGRIVLSVGFVPEADAQEHGEVEGCTPEQKVALDELHKSKIQLADEILVLNVGGYLGDSTRSEVQYAEQLGKRIRWLEPHKEIPET